MTNQSSICLSLLEEATFPVVIDSLFDRQGKQKSVLQKMEGFLETPLQQEHISFSIGFPPKGFNPPQSK